MKLIEKLLYLVTQRPIVEMAKIDQIDDLEVWVYTEPLKQKSIHLMWDKKQNEIVVTYPELKILEIKRSNKSKYSFKKYEYLSGDLLNKVNTLLNRKHKNRDGYLNKDFIEDTWDALNPR